MRCHVPIAVSHLFRRWGAECPGRGPGPSVRDGPSVPFVGLCDSDEEADGALRDTGVRPSESGMRRPILAKDVPGWVVEPKTRAVKQHATRSGHRLNVGHVAVPVPWAEPQGTRDRLGCGELTRR